jgi:hypothetical protein
MRIMPAPQWQKIHRWDMSADDIKGVVVYLRSLDPRAHGADLDWGGR